MKLYRRIAEGYTGRCFAEVEAVEIPWCAQHGSRMSMRSMCEAAALIAISDEEPGDCRLEQRHIVIEVTK